MAAHHGEHGIRGLFEDEWKDRPEKKEQSIIVGRKIESAEEQELTAHIDFGGWTIIIGIHRIGHHPHLQGRVIAYDRLFIYIRYGHDPVHPFPRMALIAPEKLVLQILKIFQGRMRLQGLPMGPDKSDVDLNEDDLRHLGPDELSIDIGFHEHELNLNDIIGVLP